MDVDRIKRRIRGLLNLAKDDGAADGEIDNAMRMAAELMNEHHLSEADIAAAPAATGGAVRQDDPLGHVDAATGAANFSTWEGSLCWAIVELVGSVKHYRHREATREVGGFFKRTETGPGYRFYGPAEDAALAAELFTEWRQVIAAMAAGKYGTVYKGDGAMYAYGFASALLKRAKAAAQERAQISTDATRALVFVGSGTAGGSLAQVLAGKRAKADNYAKKTLGVKLTSRGGGGGYRAGSIGAYGAGRQDGARADFSAARRAKLT